MDIFRNTLQKVFKRTDQRSKKARKHIGISFFIKGISIATGFILVPMMLDFLSGGDPEVGKLKYGIWITLYSVIEWIGFFDMGIGHGLRNKFAEALAKNDKVLAKRYVSTAYVLIAALFILVGSLFFLIAPSIEWADNIFNLKNDVGMSPEAFERLRTELVELIYLVVVIFCLRMILALISVILKADQRPSISNAVFPAANLLVLVFLFLFYDSFQGSLVFLGILVSMAPVFILFVYTIYFFNRGYKSYRPSFKYFKIGYFRDIFTLGVQFFIIQIAVLVIFYSDNMIITQVIGPEYVASYNVAFKYFNIITMIFNIIVTPFWSAYTEAYTKNDYKWIRETNTGLLKVWGLSAFGIAFLILISDWFYRIWIGEELYNALNITILLSTYFGLFVLISTWNNIFATFINGTGKLRIQLYGSIIMATANIPISIYFARNLGLGNAGVILGTCVTLFPGAILGPIQYKKIISNRARGIWNK